MSSSKNTSNSNKTAHVMNLLRKNNAPAASPAPSDSPVAKQPMAQSQTPPVPEAPEQTQAATPGQSHSPAPSPQAPPIISALNADTEISLQIRDALNEALTLEESTDTQAFQPEPRIIPPEPPLEAVEAPSVPVIPEPVLDQGIQAQLEAATAEPVRAEAESTTEANIPSASTPVQKQEDPDSNTDPEDVFVLYNIAQKLVEENVDKYIKAFGVCPCRRCRNDIIALSLNFIPPKYVVMHPAELILRSDMYSIRHHGEITAQIMRACKQVMEHPNH